MRASSSYDDNFRPEYAVDDNNGTLWHPRGMGQEWLEIDLGRLQQIQTIWTQFEYGTQFYQYLIETSTDGKRWNIFADKRNNHLAGSPMVDFGKAKARFVRRTEEWLRWRYLEHQGIFRYRRLRPPTVARTDSRRLEWPRMAEQ